MKQTDSDKLMDKLLGKKLEDISFVFSFRLSIHQLRLLTNNYPTNVEIKGVKFKISIDKGDD